MRPRLTASMGRRGAVAFTIAILLVPVALPAPARALSGEAEVEAVPAGTGAAVCQMAVYWRVVLVVEVEDRLGLASPARGGGSPPPFRPLATARAGCDVAVGVLTLRIPAAAGIRSTLVTGPPGFGPAPQALEEDGGFVVCRRVVLVESVVIGGGAAGLPTGRAGPVLSYGDGPSDPAAAVRCHSQVEWVSIRPGRLYQKVDARPDGREPSGSNGARGDAR